MDHRARPRGGRILGLYRLQPHPQSASIRSGFRAGWRHRRVQRAARTPIRIRTSGRPVLRGDLGGRPLAVGRLSVRLGRRLLDPAARRLHLRAAPLGAPWQRLRLRPRQLATGASHGRPHEQPPNGGSASGSNDHRPRAARHGPSNDGPRKRPSHDRSRQPRHPDAHDDRTRQPRHPDAHDDRTRQPRHPDAHDDRSRRPQWWSLDDHDESPTQRRPRTQRRSQRRSRARICPRPLASARRSRRGT